MPWKTIKLREICTNIYSGGTPRTSIKKYYEEGAIPWLNTKEINFCRIHYTKQKITKAGLDNSSAKWVPANAIIIAMYGATAGKVAISKIPLTTNQACCNLIVDGGIADYSFVYYSIVFRYGILAGLANGGAQQNLNAGIIKDFNISLPPLHEQKRISGILGSLDDKIELNRKMNENLEQQAAALFKHWFIDFEFPDAKGKPYRSSGGKMKDSPLGLIPEEWECSLLAQVATVVGGGTPSKAKEEYYCEDGIAWITPKDLSLNKNKFISKGSVDVSALGYSKSGAKLIPTGSILFSSRAPIGYIAIAMNDICTNQGFKSVVPSSPHGTAFLYYYLKNNVKLIESKSTGSTFKEASGALMKSLDIIAPPSDLLSNFEKYCTSLFDMQLVLENEINKLSTLRNSLLVQLFNPNL